MKKTKMEIATKGDIEGITAEVRELRNLILGKQQVWINHQLKTLRDRIAACEKRCTRT